MSTTPSRALSFFRARRRASSARCSPSQRDRAVLLRVAILRCDVFAQPLGQRLDASGRHPEEPQRLCPRSIYARFDDENPLRMRALRSVLRRHGRDGGGHREQIQKRMRAVSAAQRREGPCARALVHRGGAATRASSERPGSASAVSPCEPLRKSHHRLISMNS